MISIYVFLGSGACCCSPCCCALWVFGVALLLAALAALIIALIGMRKSSTTTTTSTSSSSTSSTATTTSTTTTVFNCNETCLNQSWIDPSGGMVYWPFDGTYDDVVGGHNPISISNLPTFVTGYLGKAVSFNASAKQAIYTPFIQLNNRSFTVEAWIQPNGYPNPQDHSLVGLCRGPMYYNCLHLQIRYGKLYLGFDGNDLGGITNITLNKWTHVAFVFDITTYSQITYINGILDAQRIALCPLLNALGNLTIGTNVYMTAPLNYFQGYMDELSINQRAKSACEILERATLAARFNFDSSSPYTDSGPNNVPTNQSMTSIITGYKNQAISFTGSSSSYFQTWGFTSLDVSNQVFSIALWIKPRTLSGTVVHLSTSSTGTGPTCFPMLGFASNGAIVAQVLTSSGTVVSATGPILPISSSWILVVETWNAINELRLYINNNLISSVAASTFLGSETTPNYLTLGNCLSGCGSYSNGSVGAAGPYTGAIDNWQIYSRELSSNDVCTLYYSA